MSFCSSLGSFLWRRRAIIPLLTPAYTAPPPRRVRLRIGSLPPSLSLLLSLSATWLTSIPLTQALLGQGSSLSPSLLRASLPLSLLLDRPEPPVRQTSEGGDGGGGRKEGTKEGGGEPTFAFACSFVRSTGLGKISYFAS